MDLIDTATSSQPKNRNTDASNAIPFSIGDSAAGKILVARSTVGICAILIGAHGEELKRDLAARFPEHLLIENESGLRDDLAKIIRFIENPVEGLDLPLDIRHGTPFQRRVWTALRAIPRGATATYATIARRIGEPKAARAVAGACAANAIALGIPCHRVVRSNGALSGYRWGIDLKRALIEKEAKA